MHKHYNETPIEDARETLRNQHITSFLGSLHNKDSPEAERRSLHKLMQLSIQQLITLEKAGLAEFFEEDLEEICPGCLHKASWRTAQVKNIAILFNEMLTSSKEQH